MACKNRLLIYLNPDPWPDNGYLTFPTNVMLMLEQRSRRENRGRTEEEEQRRKNRGE
jgi:hypothetical protein